MNFDVVQLCVRTLDEMNVYITSYVVPVICSPVSNQRSRATLECYPYLQGLQLACDTSDSVGVDVLIGADYYWSFFTRNIIKGDPHGPVALETSLELGFIRTNYVPNIDKVMRCESEFYVCVKDRVHRDK